MFSINNTGAMSITASIAAGSSNNVILTSTGTIAENGSGLISGKLADNKLRWRRNLKWCECSIKL